MYSSAIANLEQRVENLEEKNNKQAEEINILKAVLNNICESIREDKEKINTLMLQKDTKLSDLYPTMHCGTGTCSCCDELYLDFATGDSFKYTCKKKNISIVANTTPKPENFSEE